MKLVCGNVLGLILDGDIPNPSYICTLSEQLCRQVDSHDTCIPSIPLSLHHIIEIIDLVAPHSPPVFLVEPLKLKVCAVPLFARVGFWTMPLGHFPSGQYLLYPNNFPRTISTQDNSKVSVGGSCWIGICHGWKLSEVKSCGWELSGRGCQERYIDESNNQPVSLLITSYVHCSL